MNRKESFSTKVKLFSLFAGPSMLAFTCVVFLPFIYGLYLTLTSWDGFSAQKEFVGLRITLILSGIRISGRRSFLLLNMYFLLLFS